VTALLYHLFICMSSKKCIKDKNNFINIHLCITKTFSRYVWVR